MFIIVQACYNGRCVEEEDLCDGWTTTGTMPAIPGGSDTPAMCDCTGLSKRSRRRCCSRNKNGDGTCCDGCTRKGRNCK